MGFYDDGQILVQYQKHKLICEVGLDSLKKVQFNVGSRCLARHQKKMQPATVVNILEEFKSKVRFNDGRNKVLPNDSLQPLADDEAGLGEVADLGPSAAELASMTQPMLVVGHFCYAKHTDGRYYAARVTNVANNGNVTVEFRLLKQTTTLPVADVQSIAFQVDERCKAMHEGKLTDARVVAIEDFENMKVCFVG